jgi:hypothetical protein
VVLVLVQVLLLLLLVLNQRPLSPLAAADAQSR